MKKISQQICNIYYNFLRVKKNKFTYSNILKEIPIVVKNSSVVDALLYHFEGQLNNYDDLKLAQELPYSHMENIKNTSIYPNHDILKIDSEPYIQKNMEYLVESVDEFLVENGNYQYWLRAMNREQNKLQNNQKPVNMTINIFIED